MNQRKDTSINKKYAKKSKNETGITIVTLVITIIVLLILAGITIMALSGDNGILKRAVEAKKETEKNQVVEMIQLEVLGTYAEADGEFDSEKFKDNVNDHLKNYNPVINEDEKTITVEIKDYEVVVDKETGEIKGTEDAKGTTPNFNTKIYNQEGKEIQEGEEYKKATIEITITNKEKLDDYKIEVKNSKGETIKANETAGKGDTSYTITEKDKYTITVIGIKDGIERRNQKIINLQGKEDIKINMQITPNGGAKYIMPTEGKAKIQAKIEETTGAENCKYSYGWSTAEKEKPTTWKETASKTTIEKTDCIAQSYYLWIKVEKGSKAEEIEYIKNTMKV